MSQILEKVQSIYKFQKLNIGSKPTEYFQYLPIKPGNDFFVNLSETTYNLSKLILNIPDILFSSTSGFYLIRTNSKLIQRKQEKFK